MKELPSSEIWESFHPAAKVLIEALLKRVDGLEAQNRILQERCQFLENRVRDLEARLNQNSSNSSRPPSSDFPKKKRSAKRKPGKRNPGGQPGHPGAYRELIPPDQVDDIRNLRTCPTCGLVLEAPPDGSEVPSPLRHQVWGITITPHVTEYCRHCGWCSQCQCLVRAELPPDVPRGSFDSELQALVGILTGRFRLSRRLVEEFLGIWNIPISIGSIQKLCEDTSEALFQPVTEAYQTLKDTAEIFMDETGWYLQGKRMWLWGAVTSLTTIFKIAANRSSKVVKELIGESFQGLLHSDRYSAYNFLDPSRRQLCWAHLQRNFRALVDRGGACLHLGQWALVETDRMFDFWHRYRDGPDSFERMGQNMIPLRARFRRLLNQGVTCGDKKAEKLCRRLLKRWPALFNFVDHEGVEPTNNVAEQALRAGVIWRKLSFGNQSENGIRFTERMLTTVATCRQHDRNVMKFLVEAIKAHKLGQPAPSLLP